MTQVPALRSALQEAAERRYGRRWRVPIGGRLMVALASAAVLAVGGWLAFTADSLRPAPDPADERQAVPSPTPSPIATPYTVNVTRLPAPEPPTTEPKIVRPRLLDAEAAAREAAGGAQGASGKLERAWETPGLDGHVFLVRKGTDWCLSVADPGGTSPGDRGVGCSTDEQFRRLGISTTVGTSYAAVIGPGRAAPTYRRADGSKVTLDVAEGGLVAIADVAPGSAVTLHKEGGGRRTDAFRAEPARTRHDCSNGMAILVPDDDKPVGDPCNGATPPEQVPTRG